MQNPLEEIDLSTLNLPPEENESEFDISECLVDPDEDIPPPIPILAFENNGWEVPILTEQNKSLIKGQAKSRKSTLLKAIGIVIASRQTYQEGGLLKSNYHRNEIAFVDTEQSKYHCYKAVKTIKYLSKKKINYYRVAGYSIEKKKYLVEEHLRRNPNCGILVIDNIVHFLFDYNDPKESRELESWIDKLMIKYNCHILMVLHENGSGIIGGKAKGHLGSLLENTCETTIRVEKDYHNKHQSIVSAALTRNGDFDSFTISLDGQGTPYLRIYDETETKSKRINI